jgi:hypothetical protein
LSDRPPQLGELIDVAGAFDLHVHSYPSLFPRLADDLGLAEAYATAGFAGFALKSHHESTASRAYLLGRLHPELRVVGGVVLNGFVGGFNPSAVEACLRTGGRVVWMPTIDSQGHAATHGGTRGYAAQSSGLERAAEGMSALREDGSLVPEIYDVLDLVRDAGAVLATGHLSAPEVVAVVGAACERGVERIVVTHALYRVPSLDLNTLEALTARGAFAEFCYLEVSPVWADHSVGAVVEAVRRVGADRCVLSSDGGQRHNPVPPEGLRLLAQSVFEGGIPAEEVDRMVRANPLALVA